MKPFRVIQYFFKQYTTFPDRVFLLLVSIGLLAGSGLIALNQWDFHFPTVLLFATHVSAISWTKGLFAIAFGFLFLFYGFYIRLLSPRSSTFLWGTGLFFWTVLVNLVFANGLQATPFSPIDEALVKSDQWMGINTSLMMAWTYHHAHIHAIFRFAYDSLVYEIIFIPVMLMLLNQRKALGMFFIAQLFSFYIGSVIYYFFPTMAPSGVFHNPFFSATQEDTSLRFFQVHHYLQVTSDQGGLIAFPSFHVVWAILLTYACKKQKIIFYPLMAYNSILIVSTVFLGWHYATDVIGGFALAAAALLFSERVYKIKIP